MILQNRGLLTVGSTVNEATFLMTLLEGTCQAQHLAEAAAANGVKRVSIPHSGAKRTFACSSDRETLYWEGQSDLDDEAYKSKGRHRL